MNLAQDRYWHLLLHVRRNVVGRLQSEIDDVNFFLSPRGRRDPAAELEATLTSFFAPPTDDTQALHPQCRFPARFAWLREQLHFTEELPVQPCPRLVTWKERMNAASVSLIFASYYMNNPASMYGHTFLRLNGPAPNHDKHLLDYAVNFGAEVPNQNGIVFAIKGLTGGYRGRFSTMPYYVKVQEYNNMESRDLWEYDLSLDSAAINRMMLHLWEMGSASMGYYFLNKNCSYQLLPILEIAQPDLRLSDPFKLKTAPAETLRHVIAQPGLMAAVRRRPSQLSTMLFRRSFLSKAEIYMVETLDKHPRETNPGWDRFPEARQALMLDSAYDLFRYRVGFKRPQPPDVQDHERALLLLRQKRPTGTPLPQAPSPVRPDQGHPTGRLGLSYGFSNRSQFEEVSIRPAAHDQDEPSEGYLAGSKLEMFHLKLRYDNRQKIAYLKQLLMVDLVSLTPWDRWVRAPSWKFNFGLTTANDLNLDPGHDLFFKVNLGAGPSFRLPLGKNTLAYGMAELDSGLGDVFRDAYRFGGGANGGIMAEFGPRFRIRFDAQYLNYPVGDVRSAVKLHVIPTYKLSRTLSLRAQLQRQNRYKEALLSLFWSM